MAWGRFFCVLPKTSRLASFFSEKNSSDEASSKGWMGFFLVNFFASGRRSECRALSASWTTCEHDVPRRKRHVLGFSMALGSRFSSARLERALRGFLRTCQSAWRLDGGAIKGAYTWRSIVMCGGAFALRWPEALSSVLRRDVGFQ